MKDPLRDRLLGAVGDAYDIGPEVGRGGVAVVYRATDRRLKRDVAIKVLPPELAFRTDVRTRFLREAEMAAQLAHPHIVPIYSVDDQGDVVYFVMQLVHGESLGARLVRKGKLEFAEVRRILCEVGDALDYAHARGVVHRDIKPDNILIDADSGRSLVTDFGIARAAEGDTRLTATGVAMGTPTYMSPEQALGERELDGRSDIYSLGVVGYQMLAGVPPFRAANTPAMLMKHINEPPPPLRGRRPDMPEDLERVVDRALAKRPEERWQRGSDIRAVLEGRAPAPRVFESLQPAVHAPPTPVPAGEHQAARRAPAPLPVPAPARAPAAPVPPGTPAEPRDRQPQKKKKEKQDSIETFAARPLDQKLRVFRAQAAGSAGTIGALAMVNVMTSPEFLWFIFPAVFMTIGVLQRGAVLWGDGVRVREMFRGRPAAAAPPALPPAEERANQLVSADVLAGPAGGSVRRAVANQVAIEGIVQALSSADRALIPDVLPTVKSLVTRAASLAQMLHQLDHEISPEMLGRLDERLRSVEAEPDGAVDRERRISLLRRQRSTLEELSSRRGRVAAQLDSAVIALDNLKFDLLKLRSAGIQAGLQDVNNATVEARALSRDIGHALDAVEEVRGL